MMPVKTLSLALAALAAVSAAPSPPAEKCNCHTWHNVTAYKGNWTATLTPLHEACTFIKPLDKEKVNCTTYDLPRGHFDISAGPGGEVGAFGYRPGPTADFNSMYALTLTRTDNARAREDGTLLFPVRM